MNNAAGRRGSGGLRRFRRPLPAAGRLLASRSMPTVRFASAVLLAGLLGRVFAVDAADGPVDVPDEFGLGERLALVAWLRDHHVAIADADDLAGLRAAYRQATHPPAAAPAGPSPDAERLDELKTRLWVRHHRSIAGSPPIDELAALLARLDAEADAALAAQRAEADRLARLQPRPTPAPAPEPAKTAAAKPASAATAPPSATAKATAAVDDGALPAGSWREMRSETGATYRILAAEVIEPLRRRPGPKPAWYGKAIRFMDATIARAIDPVCEAAMDNPYKLADELRAEGCDDPGVWATAYMHFDGQAKEPDRVYSALERGGYALRLRAAIARRITLMTYRPGAATQSETHQRYVRIAGDLGIKLLSSDVSDPRMKSLLAEQLGQATRTFYPWPFNLEWIAACVAEIDRREGFANAVDPWLAAMIRGQSELMLAWRSRGNGKASSVTEEGWAGFRTHQDAARARFEAAWSLDPSQPFAATQRIVVAMGSSEGSDAVLTWLDRAATACPDHQASYRMAREAFSWSWANAPELALEVGHRAARTGDFSSPAAFLLFQANPGPGMARRRSDEDTWTEVGTVLHGYAVSPAYAEFRPYFLRRVAAGAYGSKRFDAVLWALNELGEKPDDPAAFDRIFGEGKGVKAAETMAEYLQQQRANAP